MNHRHSSTGSVLLSAAMTGPTGCAPVALPVGSAAAARALPPCKTPRRATLEPPPEMLPRLLLLFAMAVFLRGSKRARRHRANQRIVAIDLAVPFRVPAPRERERRNDQLKSPSLIRQMLRRPVGDDAAAQK